MRNLLCILLVACLAVVPACGMDVSLELGTIGLRANVQVDEWAQANVLKSLDNLVAAAIDKDEESKLSPESEAVPE